MGRMYFQEPVLLTRVEVLLTAAGVPRLGASDMEQRRLRRALHGLRSRARGAHVGFRLVRHLLADRVAHGVERHQLGGPRGGTRGWVFDPRPKRCAIPLASTVATRKRGERSGYASGGCWALIRMEPPGLRPAVPSKAAGSEASRIATAPG